METFEQIDKIVNFILNHKRPVEQFIFLSDSQFSLQEKYFKELMGNSDNHSFIAPFNHDATVTAIYLSYGGVEFHFIKTSTLP